MIHYYMGLWVDYIEWNLREIDMVVVYVWAILLLQCLFWRKFLLSCWAVPPQKLLFFWLLLGQAAAIAVVLLLQNLFTIQDYLRAELQNITQCCLFLMLYAWIALNWAGTCLLSTYLLLHIYLLTSIWMITIFWINCPRHQAYCMCQFWSYYHFKIEISLIPGQMLGALFTSANIHTYWQLAVGKTL